MKLRIQAQLKCVKKSKKWTEVYLQVNFHGDWIKASYQQAGQQYTYILSMQKSRFCELLRDTKRIKRICWKALVALTIQMKNN